jgi:transcriptional regulator with XRE-family HTH domain
VNTINLDKIGTKISKIRKEKGLTLRDLSEYTGFSVGFLSNLETGKSSPTVNDLQWVAEILGTDIITILTDEKSPKMIIRKNERIPTIYPDQNMTDELIDFGYDRQIYRIITIEPGKAEKGRLARHIFSEVCIVIEGTLTIEFEDQSYDLEKGDSVYIERRKLHRIFNRFDKPAISYWVFHK